MAESLVHEIPKAGRWRAIFHGAADIALSSWPIVRREFVGLLRTRKAFWIAVLTVGVASLLPLFSWPDPGSPFAFIQAMRAFSTYSWTLSFAFFFCVPAVAAVAITTERERDTYDLLYGTRIRPSGIILGKLIASTGFFALLFALTFPMAAVVYLLGGFEVADFAVFAGGQVIWIGFMDVVGLWFSIRRPRSFQALVGTYWYLLLFLLMTVIIVNVLAFAFGVGGPGSHFVSIVTSALWGLLSLGFLTSLIRSARLPDLPTRTRAGDWREVTASRLSKVPRPPKRSWLVRRILRPAREGIPDGWNPVFAATSMASGRGAVRWLWLSVSLMFVFGLVATTSVFMGNMGTEFAAWFVFLMANVFLVATALIFPGAAAASLSSERELGNLDFLRSTLLTPFQILAGKLGGVLAAAGSALIPGCLFFAVLLPFFPPEDLRLAVPLGLTVAFSFLGATVAIAILGSACGLAGAVVSRTTVTATIVAYLLMAGILWLAPYLVFLLIGAPWDCWVIAGVVSPHIGFVAATVGYSNGGLGILLLSLSVAWAISAWLFGFSVDRFRARWMRGR